MGGENLRNYETVFILDPAIGDDRTAQEVERAKSAIESANGEVVDIQRWGKRKLAYEIKKKREGVYTVLKFRSDGKAVFELERNLRLSEPVLRFLTVQDESPSTESKEAREAAGDAAETPAGTGESGASGPSASGAEGSVREPGVSGPENESPSEEPVEERRSDEVPPSEEMAPAGDEAMPEGGSKPEA